MADTGSGSPAYHLNPLPLKSFLLPILLICSHDDQLIKLLQGQKPGW